MLFFVSFRIMGVLALNQFSKTTMAGTKQYLII